MSMRKKAFFAALMAFAALVATADTVLTFTPSANNTQTTESIPTDVSSPATGAFTWEAWFKASDLTLAENRMVAQTGWAWNNEGRLVLEIRNHSSTGGNPKLAAFYRYNSATVRLCGPTTISSGWHHAALVRDGTDIALYLDGALETSTNNYVNATPSGVSTAPFLIGPAFYGSLAEVRLWNVARTAVEIASTKDRRLTGNEANLLGYWPLDEGTATVTPTNIVTGVAATPVSMSGNTVGYNQGAGTAAYADDAGLTLTPVPAAGTVYTTTAAGGKWSEIAWTPSRPVSGTGARIVLAGTGAFENDLGTFSLNALTFSATAALSGDGLVFATDGTTTPTLATTGAVTNDVNVAMRLDAPLTWTGDTTAGSMRLNGPLSGTGDLIHDPTVVNIIDYINGNNLAWSGNLDQRLSFIVISNSANLGTGTYYCTNETQRANGRNTLRIYGQNTFSTPFYLGTEANGAAARVDIFKNTTFSAPLYVAGTKLGILAAVTVNGGISNWNSSASARHVTLTTGGVNGRVDINAPISVAHQLGVNGQRKDHPTFRMKVYLNCAGNVFRNYMPIAGGELFCTVPNAYAANAYFAGQAPQYSGTSLGGTLDVSGHDATLGYHQDTGASFVIANGNGAAMPTVRVNQTIANSHGTLTTSGPMHLIKDGPQHLQITNAFYVAGTLEVAAGVLRLTVPAEGRLADVVIVRAGATLDLGGNTFACGTLVQSGGTICNGTLAVDVGADVSGGTVAATLVGADLALTGTVSYANSVAATKTLSTNGLVFYMPFDDAATYLTDEGPDRVAFACTKSTGLAARDTDEKRFGEGALRLDGSSPLAPVGGALMSGTTFPASIPHGDSPYTVAICYKINPTVADTVEMSVLGYGTDAATQCNNYTFNKSVTVNSVLYNPHTIINHWYHSSDMWLPLGHNVSRKDGKWHSLVTTWNGTIFRMYDDGIEVTPLPKNANRNVNTPPNVGTTKFLLGSQIRAATIWNGWLDEIAIFNRAISADEVLAYHLNGVKGGMAPTQTLSVGADSTATVGHSLTNGLVFHMPFDSAETYLQDEGPDQVTLSCQKTVRHTTLGTARCDTNEKRFGSGSLYLDGNSPLVPTGGTLLNGMPTHVPTGAAAYSFACAFKSADASTGRGFIGYGKRATNSGNNYAWNSDVLLNNYYWGCDMRPYALAPVLDGAWHTLVATWDGNGVWRFWVDGDELAQYGLNRTTYPNVQAEFFWVGATLNGNAWYGWIDELAIWNRALTTEEALSYHVNGVGKGGMAFGPSARVDVAPGGTLKTTGGVSLAGTLAAAGTIDGDLTLADGVTVEEQSGGTPSVTGRVTIEGTGSFVPCTYPTGPGAEWTVLTALGGFTAGADVHAQTWGIPNLAQTFVASGNAFGTTFVMRAYPRGTILLFR